MDGRNPAQFKIGLFVIVGVAILVSAVFLFGIRNAIEPTQKFETYITGKVEGLSIGSPVKMRGVTVGRVDEIAFSWKLYQDADPHCVVLRCEFEQRFSPVAEKDFKSQVHVLTTNGLRAVVQAQGITGTSIVSLEELDPTKYPPLEVPWHPKYPYIPSAPSQFGQILQSIDHLLAHLETLDLSKTLDAVNHTLATADVTIEKFGQFDVAGISRKVDTLSTDATTAVREVEGLVKEMRSTLDAMHLEALGTDTDRVINDLGSRLQTLIDKLNSIDVRSLNDTLADTREAARNLNDAIEALKAHPSGFIFGQAPPPVKGLEE
ncbi:MAG: MCE family protein, partial [Acidobacteria bacterium]